MSNQPQKTYRFIQPTEPSAELNDGAWERARVAIEKLKRAYVDDWAPASLDEIERALKLAGSQPEAVREHLDAVYRLAHDMKGQGATFGYVLMSDIGAALSELSYERDDATKAEIKAMLAHVTAARAVLSEELEDPNCAEAQALLGKLKSVVRANLH